MKHLRGFFAAVGVLGLLTLGASPGAAAPEGQMTWGLHFSPTPAWFDPGEISGSTTPYIVLYALHDAMIRPSPGHPMAPSLAEDLRRTPGLTLKPVAGQVVDWVNFPGQWDPKFSVARSACTTGRHLRHRSASDESG